MSTPLTYLTLRDAAALLGLQYSTLRTYHRDGKVPEPDAYVGAVPGWERATILAYAAERRAGEAKPRRGRPTIAAPPLSCLH